MKILCVSFKPAKSLNVGIGVKIYFIVYEHLQLATLKGEEGEKTEHWQQGVTLLLDTSTPSGGKHKSEIWEENQLESDADPRE